MTLIQSYHTAMYEENIPTLRTGDVIALELEDFQGILRDYEALDQLLREYYQNEEYLVGNSEIYWSVLNKSCDMVHDPEKSRCFTTNLLVAPVQPLEKAIIKGTLGDIVKIPQSSDPVKIFLQAFKKFLEIQWKEGNPKSEVEEQKEYQQRMQSIVEPSVDQLQEALDEAKFLEFNSGVLDILEVLKNDVEGDVQKSEDLKAFESSKPWKQAVKKLNMQSKAENSNDAIVLNSKARTKLASLMLNQLDSQGIFFYEPTTHLSVENCALSFLIQLEDIISFKIDKNSQESGDLFQLLFHKRRVSLQRNFSDRLLNIMGNYFSKIGTLDLNCEKILALYSDSYGDRFQLN